MENKIPFLGKINCRDFWIIVYHLHMEIEQFHLSEPALSRLKKDGVHRVRDLYEADLRQEPGWYAVRELFEKIQSTSPVSTG